MPGTGEVILKAENLHKRFKNLEAVRGVSFEVYKEEIFGFLGPNGAGKTTTINMLATLVTPSEGDAHIAGFSVLNQRDDVRRSIGMVFQDPSLDDRLTAEENLRFHAKLYGVDRATYLKRREEVLKLVELWDRRNDIVRTFSGGMRRRLEIARGLIHHPKLLFLDEPTIGLDPQTRAHLWDYLLKLKRERRMTVFMTTHYMNEAEYCDRICVIDHGQIIALDTPENLKKSVGQDIVTIKAKDAVGMKAAIAARFPEIKITEEDGTLHLPVVDGHTFLPHLLSAVGEQVESVTLREPSLDDVFLGLTGRSIRDEAATSMDQMRTHHGRMGGRH